MDKFAFLIHPVDVRRDASLRFPWARYVPLPILEWRLKQLRPYAISHITGVRSPTGAEAEGWFIACPLSPRQFTTLPLPFVYDRIIECGRIAEDLGARIVGLGAMTSVVGDNGVTVAKNLGIAVTTGNSYTVAVAIEETLRMARRMQIGLPAEIAVVGATGSIGSTCAEILGPQASRLVLIGRNPGNLQALAERLQPTTGAEIATTTDITTGIRNADIVVTVTSAVDSVIDPGAIKSGAVICDVARPRDVSRRVVEQRDDVLVIDGGMVQPPGEVQFGINFGYPPGLCVACMAETIMLTLEGRYESFTLGKRVTVEQVREIQGIADRHGFQVANPRSFERGVTDEQIDRIRERASLRRAGRPRAPQAAPA